jgi:hypothetical protein
MYIYALTKIIWYQSTYSLSPKVGIWNPKVGIWSLGLTKLDLFVVSGWTLTKLSYLVINVCICSYKDNMVAKHL